MAAMGASAAAGDFTVAGVSVPRAEYNQAVSELSVIAGTEVSTPSSSFVGGVVLSYNLVELGGRPLALESH